MPAESTRTLRIPLAYISTCHNRAIETFLHMSADIEQRQLRSMNAKRPKSISVQGDYEHCSLFRNGKNGARYVVQNEACQSPVSEPGPVFRDPNMGVISSASIVVPREPGLPALTGEVMSGNHCSTVQMPCILLEAGRGQGPVSGGSRYGRTKHVSRHATAPFDRPWHS